MKNELFVCECEFLEHSLVLRVDDDEGWMPSAFVCVHLSQSGGFFKRLKRAFLYVLGRRSPYGDYAEFMLKHGDIDRMIKILTDYKQFTQDCSSWH
jgi:hypothetical protein